MKYESQRITLRDFKPEEFDLYASVFSNDQVMKYTYMDVITDKHQLNLLFLDLFRPKEPIDHYVFAVFLSDSNVFIGIAEIFIHYHFSMIKNGEIGYYLLPDFWGLGYATEIGRSLINICFDQLKLPKVIAHCNANNVLSEKIMQKLGMIKEAELRMERFKNERWDNELCYGILTDEWKKSAIVP